MSGILPTVRRTKGGANEKEPAFLILRRHFVRIAMVIALCFSAGVLLYARQNGMLERTMYKWQEKARTTRFFQHRMHAQAAMLGQELEEHLTRDARESELAERIVERIALLEVEYQANVTRAVSRAVAGVGVTAAPAAVEAAAQAAMAQCSRDLFARLSALVKDGLVKRLTNEGDRAEQRAAELHQKVADELRHERSEARDFLKDGAARKGDLDGDGLVEDRDGDGRRDASDGVAGRIDDELGDDGWRVEERWHRNTIDAFFQHFDEHFEHDPFAHTTALPSDALVKELEHIMHELDADELGWRDADKRVHARAAELERARLPAPPEIEPPPEDVEFEYEQLWQVRDYLGSALFAARLHGEKAALEELRREVDLGPSDGGKAPLEVIGVLEDMAGRDIFPPHWLFHEDYSDYGDFIGDYFPEGDEPEFEEGEAGGGEPAEE